MESFYRYAHALINIQYMPVLKHRRKYFTILYFIVLVCTTYIVFYYKGAFKYYISTLGGGGGLKVICLYCLWPKGGVGG